MNNNDYSNRLKNKGLRITPQRVAILEAVDQLHNHPTADQIIERIRQNYPNIATGTVYKVLDTLVLHRLINKVKSDQGTMRYDATIQPHHHLYSSASERIEDYYDYELTQILQEYFNKKKIPGFNIEEIKLQIIGKFRDH